MTADDRAHAIINALVRDMDPTLRAWDFLRDYCGIVDPGADACRFAWWCAVHGMYGAIA